MQNTTDEKENGTPVSTTAKPDDSAKITKKNEETVQLPKSTLDAILQKLEDAEIREKKRDEEIEMLKGISDKGRLTKWEEQNKGTLIRTAKVTFWEGNPVLGWMTVKDEVGFREGRLVVNQIVRLFIDIGEKEPKQVDLDYLYWAQNVSGETGEVINKNVGRTGEVWTIQLKDGRKLDIDIRFINAF